ncbi:TAR DNA-binding protein 43-like isoform X2 [Arctopsyche grandis]|uniref:TAR DNA-binding protein 43-like isoform X2 n=1 Tax=Arctopsyche grandis TaxID=121162 RepID=UPI00406D6880
MSSPVHYLQVCEEEPDEPVEVPLEPDGSLLLSTVAAQFFGCCGLKFRCSGGPLRGLRLAGDRLFPPDGGWGLHKYICVFPRQRDPDPRPHKLRCSDLIVLGLPWKTDEDALRDYFRSFGDLLLVQIKRDPKTGSSKGFGFVKFYDYDAQIKVLAQRHLIDGRWCDVRIPNSKEGLVPKVPSKVFVGRCTENITADDLREYFSKFGQVTDVFIPKPFRAFSFVTFLDPEVAQSLCGEDHIIKGVSVNISNASPKQDQYKYHQIRSNKNQEGGRHSRTYQNSPQSQWTGRSVELVRSQGQGAANNGNGQSVNVNLPLNINSIPVNQALIAAALNQPGWGIVNNVPVEGYQGPPTQAGPVSHQRAGFLNWVPPNNNGNDSQGNQWPHQPDVTVKNYVKTNRGFVAIF